MPLILAAPLPSFAAPTAEARLQRLCASWERALATRLSPAQLAHCRRFGTGGEALNARASRLLVRLLALRVLPQESMLDRDEHGRPRVSGTPGWQIAFSHSGSAAFCLVLGPRETASLPAGHAALDAEACGRLPPTDRGFTAPAPSRRAALRRWVLAEALFKALGAPAARWGAVATAAEHAGGARSGRWRDGADVLSWHFFAAPGHAGCVALPGSAPFFVGLRWLAWQSLPI